jgi:quinol monooxygenase YgiN
MKEIEEEITIIKKRYQAEDGRLFDIRIQAEDWERTRGLKKVIVLASKSNRDLIVLFDNYADIEKFYEKNESHEFREYTMYVNDCKDGNARMHQSRVRNRRDFE